MCLRGQKKLSNPQSSIAGTTKDTAYTFKTWSAPAENQSTSNTGVTFEFKLAV